MSNIPVDVAWHPDASLSTLRQRAVIMAQLRQFFYDRQVWEVETPLLAPHSVTDPYMEVIATAGPRPLFLQTSPEYAMKRLLAAGSGAIFQICKAFRREELGSRHNPEFTMLEWYRPGFDHLQLMTEVADLVEAVLGCKPCERASYGDLFERHLGINPHTADIDTLRLLARSKIDVQMRSDVRDDWLNILLAEIIEPQLGLEVPIFIFDYPISQCALAKLDRDATGTSVAQRFELYFKGVELANGYHELTDGDEQRRRFEMDRHIRKNTGRPDVAIDEDFMAAVESGLPNCAGVALGVDRLLMLALGLDSIDKVLSFSAKKYL